MRQHLKQAAFTCGLALPLIVTLLFSKPFTADSVAQAGLHMVGPQFPILVDNGDGRPGGGDTQLLPRQSGANTLELPTVFSCGTQPNNVVTLGSPDASGKFRTASRTNNGRDQAINIAGTSGGGASQFSYMETAVGSTFASGSGALMDMNGDGAMDAMSLGGTNGSGVVSLVFTPDSNYVSIPASQAALLGARQGRCGPRRHPRSAVLHQPASRCARRAGDKQRRARSADCAAGRCRRLVSRQSSSRRRGACLTRVRPRLNRHSGMASARASSGSSTPSDAMLTRRARLRRLAR